MEAFKADIKNSDLIKNPKSNATELAQQYDSVLSTLFDFHASLATKKISPKPPNLWMTPAILASKRYRRYLERVWRRYPTALNRSRLSKQIHLCIKQMSKAKSAHYSKIIAEHSGDHRSLWQAFNKILHRCPKMYLPHHSSIIALANTFSSFFVNKISIIRSSFPSGLCSNVLTPPNTRKVLHNLSHVTDAEVRRLVLSAPCKSSDLDPLPTGLVKDCVDVLVTPIVSIVNLSLSEGCFPTHFKSTLVSSLLKTPTLNREFLLIGNERQRSKYLSMFPIELLGVKTYPAKNSARNLGVIFDKNFNFRSHISAIYSSCIYHIRDLRHICRHFDLHSAKLLANALVSSRLEYCNSVLSGIAETDITKLQRVLNRLACVVTKSPPFSRSVPLLRSLHWLPVKYRVHFKICLLTYEALHEEQLTYLCSLIATSLPPCSLRSNRGITLSVPRIKTNTGTGALSSYAPSLLNNLPLSVRSATSVATFRRRLILSLNKSQ